MRLTGLKYGQQLLKQVEFPVSKVLTEDSLHEEINDLITRDGKVVVKPVFLGGVGKKGKAGLVRIVDNIYDAIQAKKDPFQPRHRSKIISY